MPVRDRRRVRGHGDRRHRPGPHRQGRGLPPGRDGPTADYPGIYHMVSIAPGRLAPAARRARTAATASTSTPRPRPRSSARGYIIGRLQRVIFYEPGIKETNWSVDARGDGRRRRRAALGLPALLQGGPAVDQLARPVLRRHAAGDRRRAARARRPRRRRPAAGRQRLPRRREVRRGGARVVGGPSALARPPTT